MQDFVQIYFDDHDLTLSWPENPTRPITVSSSFGCRMSGNLELLCICLVFLPYPLISRQVEILIIVLAWFILESVN